MFRLAKSVTNQTQKIKVQNVYTLPVENTKRLMTRQSPRTWERPTHVLYVTTQKSTDEVYKVGMRTPLHAPASPCPDLGVKT